MVKAVTSAQKGPGHTAQDCWPEKSVKDTAALQKRRKLRRHAPGRATSVFAQLTSQENRKDYGDRVRFLCVR